MQNGTTHVIFLSGFGFPKNIDTSSYEVGLQRVQILKPDIPDVTMPDDVITIDVTNPQVSQKYFNTKKKYFVT